MTRKIFVPGLKDETGAFVRETPVSPTPEPVTDVSIDSLLLKGLTIIDRMMKIIMTDVSTGSPSRESVMNLKDAMTMLHELKKKEAELLDTLSDEELENAAD